MKKIVITGQIPVAKLANYLIAIKTCGAVPVHIEPGDNTDIVNGICEGEEVEYTYLADSMIF